MLDSYLRSVVRSVPEVAGKFLARAHIPANLVTIVGFSFAVAGFAALVLHFYMAALVFIVVNRLLDGIDGAVARHMPDGATDFGGFLDIVTDMIFYAGFVFFFAVGRPEEMLPAAFLLFSFMGTSTTFLTYAIIAEKRGMKTEARGKKSFFYLGGLIEGTETFIAFVLICLFPDQFTLIAVIFGLLCWLTTIGRVRMALRDFR